MSTRLKTQLEPNDIIKRPKADYNWKVISLLGAGGFGTVNKVIQVNEAGIPINDKEYAMKTEMKTVKKQASRLKIERNVMALFTKCDPQYKDHFPELIDLGQTLDLKWIVMTLVGAPLEKVKQKQFSKSTALQCGLQTMKAIHDFHHMGFLHRDIKPGNFCIGAGAKQDLIYILDFGLARKYRLPNGQVRPPRLKTKMVGTPRYCPRASHRMEELSRKDDFESWYFMLLDFVDGAKGVPWKGKPREVTYALKRKIFEEPKWICCVSTIPPEFQVMADYLNSLSYASDVEFGIFRETITDYARTCNLTLKEPLDWTMEVKNLSMSNQIPQMSSRLPQSTQPMSSAPPSSTPTSMKRRSARIPTSRVVSCDDNRSIFSERNEETSLDRSRTGNSKR
uniref:non-specific serine/threonine protein kinase n=1 Tax=Caenorhabditis tropicalis TaxID=1561998 RepID=A0A1I7TEH8_9PELO